MEIRQLEAFAAVYSTGSVTAAARLLERSQSVVSRQIQDLEGELGFTLFTRTRPQVTLTEQGRLIYDEVHNVLAGLQQLDTRTREISQRQTRPLRIGVTDTLGASLLPGVIGQLELSHVPLFEKKMSVDTMTPEQVVQAVADGWADVGLLSLPVDLGRCHLNWSGQAPCMLALPAGHPLAQHDTVPVAELGDSTVITMSNRSGLRHRISTALLQKESGGPPRRHIETTSSINALMLVRAGVGLALVDPLTAVSMTPTGVVYRSLDIYVPYLVGAITHRDRILSGEGQRIVQATWDYVSTYVPRFVAGDASGLPKAADPFDGSLPPDSIVVPVTDSLDTRP